MRGVLQRPPRRNRGRVGREGAPDPGCSFADHGPSDASRCSHPWLPPAGRVGSGREDPRRRTARDPARAGGMGCPVSGCPAGLGAGGRKPDDQAGRLRGRRGSNARGRAARRHSHGPSPRRPRRSGPPGRAARGAGLRGPDARRRRDRRAVGVRASHVHAGRARGATRGLELLRLGRCAGACASRRIARVGPGTPRRAAGHLGEKAQHGPQRRERGLEPPADPDRPHRARPDRPRRGRSRRHRFAPGVGGGLGPTETEHEDQGAGSGPSVSGPLSALGAGPGAAGGRARARRGDGTG